MDFSTYEKTSTGAVLFGRALTWIEVRGPDRVSWLQGMVSNDVSRPEAGQGCFAAHLTPQGKVVALMQVLTDAEALWILTDHQGNPGLAELLDRLLIMEDASLEDRSKEVSAFSLAGREAVRVLRNVLGNDPGLISPYEHAWFGNMHVVRSVLTYDIILPRTEAAQFESQMALEGAAKGDDDLWAVLSVESGTPRWGIDVDSTTTLPELGESAIDYAKGCYIGQEAVAKIRYVGHVNRSLRGLRIEGNQVPQPGPIYRGDREVGRLTSAVESPGEGGVIGLGYVRRGLEQEGTEIEIRPDGESLRGVVSDLPFSVRRGLNSQGPSPGA